MLPLETRLATVLNFIVLKMKCRSMNTLGSIAIFILAIIFHQVGFKLKLLIFDFNVKLNIFGSESF